MFWTIAGAVFVALMLKDLVNSICLWLWKDWAGGE
jgi:hypothetical protein